MKYFTIIFLVAFIVSLIVAAPSETNSTSSFEDEDWIKSVIQTGIGFP